MNHSQFRPDHTEICCRLISEADRVHRIRGLLQNGGPGLEIIREIYTVQKNLAAIKLDLLRFQVQSNFSSIAANLVEANQMEELEQVIALFFSLKE